MKFFLLTTLLSLLLFAQEKANPKVYESLGNEIYTNVTQIEKLKTLKQYARYKDKIDTYVSNVKDTKKFGYQVESGTRSNVKLDYLNKLREYKKVNDYFIRSVQSAFKSALDTNDNDLFIRIVNSALLDARTYKNKILGYYKAHKAEINPQGIIQTFLDEEYVYKNKKSYKEKTKKQLKEEKIARLRKNDILDSQALEKRLSDEVKEKKAKIRQKQERELFN